MLDIKFIRENPEKVKEACKNKNITVDVDKVLELDKKKRELLTQVEQLRSQQNKLGKDNREEGKKLKEEIKKLEPELAEIEKNLTGLLLQVPNVPLDDVPVGASEADNKIIKTVGKKPAFGFCGKKPLAIGRRT